MLAQHIEILGVPRRLVGGRRGFTLIEIMAVVIIMAGMYVLLLPQAASRDDLKLASAARVMVADLLYAQNRAISTQTTQFVSFTVASSGTNGGYTIYDAQPFVTPITNPLTQKPYTVTPGSGSASQLGSIIVASLNFGVVANTVLAFNELGQPLACAPAGTPVAITATASITMQCGTQTMTVSVEPDTGNITLP